MLPVEWKAVVPALVLAGIFCLWNKRRKLGSVDAGGRSLMRWLLPLFCLMLAGAARLAADGRVRKRCEAEVAAAGGERLWAEGTLERIDAGKEGRYEAVLTLSDVTLYAQGEAREFGGDVLVYLDEAQPGSDVRGNGADGGVGEPEIGGGFDGNRLRIGMRVAVRGRLESMGRASNPGEFDFGSYYHALGIEGRMFGENLRITGDGYSPYLDGIYRLKRWAWEMLSRLCGTENGDLGVFGAVVLGDRTLLKPDLRDLYRRNGIAHLLAVSGLHIALIGMGLYRLLKRRLGLGYGLAGTMAAAATVTYGILTGGSAGVVRAVVMVCVQILADRLGRTYDLLSAVSLAAVLVLAESPSLLFQAGFQMSFGAVLAIGAAYPVLEVWTGIRDDGAGDGYRGSWGGRHGSGDDRFGGEFLGIGAGWTEGGRHGSGIRQGLLLGISVQIVTLPVTAYHFYEYPVYGTVLNLLAVPLMGYVLVSGLAGLALGSVWLPAGRFAVGTGHYILRLYEWLCRGVERLPGAVQIVGRPQAAQLAVYAGGWCLALLWAARCAEREKKRAGADRGERAAGGNAGRRRLRMMVLMLFACGGYLLLQKPPVQGLHAVFLDVGQGDGICLESGDLVVLVDGGSQSRKDLGERVLEPYLKSRGIGRVDYAVVSHGDNDHVSGLRYLLEADCGIRIGTLVLPWLGEGNERYEELSRLAAAAGTDVVWMKAGDRIGREPARAASGRWIWPGAGGRNENGVMASERKEEEKTASEPEEKGRAVLEREPDSELSLQITCLYAGDPVYRGNTNDHSLLLQVTYGRAGILLTGDLSAEGEKRWLTGIRGDRVSGAASELTGPVQVLKAAHHGSSYSGSDEFLEYVAPAWTVISCGAGNRYGHPGEDTLRRLEACGSRVFFTMRGGAVTVMTDGERMRIWSYYETE